MLVDKDAHQRETITKWPIWLTLNMLKCNSSSVEIICLHWWPISHLIVLHFLWPIPDLCPLWQCYIYIDLQLVASSVNRRLLHSLDLFYFPSLNVQSDGYYYDRLIPSSLSPEWNAWWFKTILTTYTWLYVIIATHNPSKMAAHNFAVPARLGRLGPYTNISHSENRVENLSRLLFIFQTANTKVHWLP